jgi:hypothetical protein
LAGAFFFAVAISISLIKWTKHRAAIAGRRFTVEHR